MGNYVTVLAQVTTNDPLAIALTVIAIGIVTAALFIANHNLKDRF